MRRRHFLNLAAGQGLWFALKPAAAHAGGASVAIANGAFLIGGKPVQLISGEMHYPRVPREHWRHRLRMARAMGLNATTTYVFWNLHEPRPGEYDFAGNRDLRAYLQTAQEEGLHVILRPGPYVCAEWEFGGIPAWLLADPRTQCRTNDPRFMEPARRWLTRLGQEVATLQSPLGGPVVAVQVENEYGSFGDDRAYVRAVYDALTQAGFDRVIRYTDDGIPELPKGSLPGVPVAGSVGNPRSDCPALKAYRPENPVMAGEWYPGWFDHWGENHHEVPPEGSASDLSWMLANGCSSSMYMFHGGTNFGFMNGANYSDDAPYMPTTTSYDYDAPVAEGGAATPKFHVFRAAIAAHTGAQPPPIPPLPQRVEIPEFALVEHADWRDLLGTPAASDAPLHMEAYGQSYGYILYRASARAGGKKTLAFGDVRDYAIVFVNGTQAGTIDRRLNQKSIVVDVPATGATIDVLVENGGRLNYGKRFTGDRKGLIGPVQMDGRLLTGWQVFTLPMSDLSALRFSKAEQTGPAFHRGVFHLERIGDTFIDTRMLGKGVLWVNGHNAGRFWSIGPQYALYVPRSFLRSGLNEAIVFDLFDRDRRALSGRTQPLYGAIQD
jgi:beta-galactosidase